MSSSKSEGYFGLVPTILSVTALIWYTVLWSLSLLGCTAARKRYRLRPRSPLATSGNAPSVSILRPLKGLDNNLYENLESTFTQEYPNYEIFFCVADEDDQALPVVRELIAKYPNVNATVVIGEDVVGVNPKVNNLIRSYRQASHDILWVLDSNVLVDSGTLARSVDALTHPSGSSTRIALVHHVPFAFLNEPRLGSRIEEAFLNTNHAKMYIAINTVAVDSCVVGKSNIYRRSDLELVNGSLIPRVDGIERNDRALTSYGLAAFGRFLAEDNMIASALWHELGLRHELSCDVARNVVGNMSLPDYIWRRVRWIRVRKHMVLAATVLEPFTESVVAGFLASLGIRYLLGISQGIFLSLHFVLWLCLDLDVYCSLAGHPLPLGRRWLFITSWIARELLAFPIWALAIFGSEVEWRGEKYKVLRNGEVTRVSNEQNRLWGWIPRCMWSKSAEYYEPLETLG
ncbi:glycosyltransferase family 21 protein [Amanita thiersii Skay4041]|uniref:Ceramide glucosyltransferase n=1 Tax=Amanita thiersii Skay4041 TaxID=703135 RepID=A0A2A9NW65_9AGAR|nr:glycosyltransferase family 21 protein [Amanita thiersii Skay4041]